MTATDDPLAVSVVIPCFNQGSFVGQAIESALNLPVAHEVIVVDDGSTDDSAAVIQRYPPAHYIGQQNAGVSRARNAGLAAAAGTFVLFLDADDWLIGAGVLQSVATLLARPECMFVAGRHVHVGPNGEPMPDPPTYESPIDGYAELLRRVRFGIGSLASVLFRRSVFAAVGGFSPDVDATADYDLYLRVAREFPICTHDHVVAVYRRHAAGMSNHPEVMLRSISRVMRLQRPFVRAQPGLINAYREGCGHWASYYGTRTLTHLKSDMKHGRVTLAIRRLVALAAGARMYATAWRPSFPSSNQRN